MSCVCFQNSDLIRGQVASGCRAASAAANTAPKKNSEMATIMHYACLQLVFIRV